MAGFIIRTALRSALRHIRHVTPVRPRRAKGLVRQVYRQVEREFGMLAPPTALHSPSAPVLAASWLMLRESLVARGSIDRATKEIVAAAVSVGNQCPYCVEVHSATAAGLVRSQAAAALDKSRIEDIEDAETRALALWARDSGHGGLPLPTAEVVGVAVTFQYLNRMVNVFLGDSPLPPTVPAGVRPGAKAFLGRVMRSSARAKREPGAALDLLPPASADLWWAEDNPTVGDAFARAYQAIDEAGARSVPAGVRELVEHHVRSWDGTPLGINRSWAEDAAMALPTLERPAAVLALLTALASYQVDESIVDRVRVSDAELVELTAWAALTAARKVTAAVERQESAEEAA